MHACVRQNSTFKYLHSSSFSGGGYVQPDVEVGLGAYLRRSLP